MGKAVKAAVKVFVITFAVTTGLAFVFQGAGLFALGSFSAAGAFLGGVSTLTLATLSAASTLVGGLMSKGTNATAENFGTKVASRTSAAPRQIIYGKARVGGTITHIETSGTDNYKLSMIVVLAGHEVESLEEVLINDTKLTTTSSGGFQYATNSRFTNSENENKFGVSNSLLRYKFKDGSQTTADSTITGATSLGSTDKFIGMAYMLIEMVFDSEAFGGGIPPMAFVIKGKKVYDPRTSSTAWSDNPALCVRDYITDTTYGLKATSDEVLDTTALGGFASAANTCENQAGAITTATVNGAVTSSTTIQIDSASTNTLIDVGQTVTGTGISGSPTVIARSGNLIILSSTQTISDGVTLTFNEDLYKANGITNMAADGTGVLEGLLSSCAGKLSYINGKFVMFAGASVTPDMTITDDNLLAPISVATKNSGGETFNTVKAVYVDANNNYVATDSPVYTDSTLLSADTPSGESSTNYRKILELQLPFTDTTTMAQRLQRTALLHSRQEVALSVLCNVAFMQLQPFDWVYLTNERLGYTNKTFEVLSTNLEVIESDDVPILATRLALKEIDSSVYSFASSSYTNPIDEGSSVSTGSFTVTAPTNLSVSATLVNTGYDLQVQWTNNTDDLIQGTEILYGTSSGTYISSAIAGKGKTKEIIPNVKPNSTYYIVARHFSANNVFSAVTSEVTISTSSGTGINTPSAPTSLSATTGKPLNIGLSWTNPSNSDLRDIKIYRSTSSGFTPNDGTNLVRTIAGVPSVSQKVSFGIDDGLVAGTTYYFKVKAVSFFDKESSASSEASGSFTKVEATDIDAIFSGYFHVEGSTTTALTDSAFNTAHGRLPIEDDILIMVNTSVSPKVSKAYKYSGTSGSGGAFAEISNFQTGDLVVDGTLSGSKIIADSINGNRIQSSTKVTAGSGNNVGVLDGADSTFRIYAGNSTPASAPFRVSQAGALTSTSATITGSITATSLNVTNATVTGTLDAANISVNNETLDDLLAISGTGTSRILKLAYDDKNKFEVTGTSIKYTAYDQLQSDGDLAFQMDEDEAIFYPDTSEGRPTQWEPTIIKAGDIESNTNQSGITTPRVTATYSVSAQSLSASAHLFLTSLSSAPSTTTNKLYNVGGTLYFNGSTVGGGGTGDITGVTITTTGGSLTGGAAYTSGDATFTLDIGSTITGAKTFDNNVVIQGDLDVQGTTTTIDTTNLDVKDKNITLNYGTGDTSANANGAGITIQDAVSSGNDATLTWSTSNDFFNLSHPIAIEKTAYLNADGTNSTNIEIGASTTANHYAYIDLIGDATYTDYGLRIIRNNSGANTTSVIYHRGTGDFVLETQEAANLKLRTYGQDALTISSTGDVTIGATDAGNKTLTISGGATGNNEGGEIRLATAADYDTTYDFYRIDVNQDDFRIGRAGTTDLTINSSGNATFAGNVTATAFYGDGSNLTGITSTTINNNADNRIITGSGTANTLNAESTLTYDGTTLKNDRANGSGSVVGIQLTAGSSINDNISLDFGSTTANAFSLQYDHYQDRLNLLDAGSNVFYVSGGVVTFTTAPTFSSGLTVPSLTVTGNGTIQTGAAGLIKGGYYQVGSTTVIDTSRNLTNIGTISSGSITVEPSGSYGHGITINAGDNLNGNNGAKQILMSFGGSTSTDYVHSIRTRHNSGSDTGNTVEIYLWDYATDSSSTIGTKRALVLENSTGLDLLTGGYKVGGTTVINSSREIQNVTFNNSFYTDEYGKSLVGNFGQFQAHGTYSDFNTNVSMWGWNFVQGNGNNPVGISAQWYRQRISLGDAYGYGTDSGDYWMELALPRYGNGVTSNSSSSLTRSSLWVRTCEGGSIKSWSQIGGDLYNGLSIRGTDVIDSSRNLTVNQNIVSSGSNPLVLSAAGGGANIELYGSAVSNQAFFDAAQVNFRGVNGSGSGSIAIGTTVVIDSSRNLTNIGTGSFAGNVTVSAGSSYPLQVNSTQRYQLQIRNTNNTTNSGYGWWMAHDTNFNFALHADGFGDKFTLTKDGDAAFTGAVTLETGGLILGEDAYSASSQYVGMKSALMTGSSDYMIISAQSTAGDTGHTYVSAKDGQTVHIRGGGNNSSNQIRVPDDSYISMDTSSLRFTGALAQGTTTVIDSSRNLTNIGTGAFTDKVTISNANYNQHLEISRTGQGTLSFTPSASQLLLAGGGFSPSSNNAYDLGRSDKYWQDLWLGTSLKMGGTSVIDSSRNLTNIGNITATGELTLSNYAQGNMQNGALNVGRSDTNYAWSGSTWATDVRAGFMANCSETWEMIVHDSGDSVMSFMKYNGSNAFEMGNNIGWGAAPFTFAGTITSNSSSRSSFGAGTGANQGIDIKYGSGSSDYSAIRFYSNYSNIQTIHTFANAWGSGNFESSSAGAINIEGSYGVTFGSWNNPDAYITRTSGNTYFRGNLQVGDYSGGHQIEIASGQNTAAYLRFNDNNNTEGSYVRSTGATSSTGGDLIFGSRWNTDTDRIYMEMTGTTVANPNTLFKMASSSFMFGGNNNGKEANSAQISAGQHQSNSLNFVGMSSGTSSSDRRMDFWVEGKAYFRGDIVATGNVTAYGSASDKRLKKDIVKIDNAIDKIKSVSGYEFAWNENAPEDKQDKREFGVIAQEVEEAGLDKLVFEYERPVSGTDEDNKDLPDEKWKAVHYDKFVPILIEAIKEQQQQIDELKARLDNDFSK